MSNLDLVARLRRNPMGLELAAADRIEELEAQLAAQQAQTAPVVPEAPRPIAWGDIVKAIRAVEAEARRRGSMFPQTSDEQAEDRAATRRVVGMIEWYATKGGAVAEALPDWPRYSAAAPSAPIAAPSEDAKDAARYRVMRAGNDYAKDGAPMVLLCEKDSDTGERPFWSIKGEVLDNAIDAAIAATAQQKESKGGETA